MLRMFEILFANIACYKSFTKFSSVTKIYLGVLFPYNFPSIELYAREKVSEILEPYASHNLWKTLLMF